MIISRTGQSITVECPAKLNLFLECRGIRSDGYHELETVMQAVTLYDRITLARREKPGIAMTCSDLGLPAGPGNLCYKAAELFISEALGNSAKECGIIIHLEKKIPYGSGLGGGSSDAAGVIAGLNELFETGLSREQLAAMAAKIGSDCAFFIYGGTALCRGRGEKILPVKAPAAFGYLILWPKVKLPTKDVYAKLDNIGLTSGNSDATFLLDALAAGDYDRVCTGLFNRLGEPATLLAPEVSLALTHLADASKAVAMVTGSGSAVFAVLPGIEEARSIQQELKPRENGLIFAVRPESLATN